MIKTAPRRLPVDLVVRRSFAFVWESRAVLASSYAVFAILALLADLILTILDRAPGQVAILLLDGAEEVFAMAFAVGIHRYVLLAETGGALRSFRWDRHFVQYLLISLMLFLLAILGAIPGLGVVVGAAGPVGSSSAGISALRGLAFAVTAALVLSRLALMLPSAALGDGTSVRRIWEATHRNAGRLLATMFLTVLPFLIIQGALVRLLPDAAKPVTPGVATMDIVVTIVWGLISPIQLIVVTTMLSLCYDALVRGG